MSVTSEEYKDYIYRRSRGWKTDYEYDPFDAKDITRSSALDCGVMEMICNDKSPCSRLVTLYALMGIHRYNLLQGKNYKFSHVEKYTFSLNFGDKTYYITLVAKDPADDLLKHFHIRINTHSRQILLATCTVAVLRGEPNREPTNIMWIKDTKSLLQWPTENPFKDTKRFHLVNNSELQDNANDWIRQYLELAVVTNRRMCNDDDDLSNLEIIKVAIKASQDPNKVFSAKSGTIYISYKDPSEARVGKDIDRVAIVRKSIDGPNQCFTLRGHNESSATMLKKVKTRRAQHLFMRRSAVLKPSRLFFARKRKAYQNRGVGFTTSLHKTRSI